MMERNAISRRSFLKLMGIGTVATAAVLSGCALNSEVIPVEELPLEAKLEKYFPGLKGEKIIKTETIYTEGVLDVVNYDSAVEVIPLGFWDLLSFYQTKIPGKKFEYKDLQGNKIPFLANDVTHKKQLLIVVPDSEDYPRPEWAITSDINGQTSRTASRKQSVTFVRIPQNLDPKDILTRFGTELAQMTLEAKTDPDKTPSFHMDEVVNNGLGDAVWLKNMGGRYSDLQYYNQLFILNGEQQPAWLVPEELFDQIPVDPLLSVPGGHSELYRELFKPKNEVVV